MNTPRSSKCHGNLSARRSRRVELHFGGGGGPSPQEGQLSGVLGRNGGVGRGDTVASPRGQTLGNCAGTAWTWKRKKKALLNLSKLIFFLNGLEFIQKVHFRLVFLRKFVTYMLLQLRRFPFGCWEPLRR